MIKSNELRIGNWVQYDSRNTTIQGIDTEHPYLNTITWGGAEYEELEPIPLTEEWLLKFGAINNGRNDWLLSPIELSWITTDLYFEYEYQTPNIEWRIIQVKYVHQLQNLYFAVTGVDLQGL